MIWDLKKRDQSLVKCWRTQYHRHTYKCGLKLPKTVEDAYTIDKATGTTFWHNAMEKEQRNAGVAVNILGDGVIPPLAHQYICCCMIFDVEIEDFWHKAQFVAGQHTMKD
jgi:hypothetical protein